MKINRTKNTIKGTITGIAYKIIGLLIPFVIRTIFIHTLGLEYLGLSSLFSSVLQVLNLMELGVGSALVFSMYKPIAEDDPLKICALMRLYRIYYRVIGLVVCAVGLLVIPFLPSLIKNDPPTDINLYVVYGMSLTSTVLSYWLFAYRNCLFQAHQRTDILNLLNIIMTLLSSAVQIFFLLVFRNYYLYLSVSIANQIFSNIITALLSKKYYPQYKPAGNISREKVHSINKKVRSLFTAKLGTTVHRSFDTIVVSAFLGLSTLAIFQNYNYIVTAVTGLVMVLYSAAQAGVGNFLISSSQEAKRELLYKFQFLAMLIATVCSCCLINLYQPFMKLWVGEKYLLEFPLVILFTLSFVVDMFMRPMLMFKDSGGMWNEDRFRPLTAALTNLVLNISTVKWLGLYGVIASTIISMLIVAVPWLLINIKRHQFDFGIKRFLFTNLKYTFVITISCGLTYLFCSMIAFENPYFNLIAKLVLSAIPSLAIFELFFFQTDENKYVLGLIRKAGQRNT